MLASYFNILVVFALVLVGYRLSRKGWFDETTTGLFSKLVLNIALPFSMFLNITKQFTRDQFMSLVSGMLVPILSIAITFIVSTIWVKVARVPATRQGVFRTMFTASNTIFMGLPINLAIFGEKAVPYVLLYYICNTTFFWTLGIYLIAQDNLEQQGRVQLNFAGVTKMLMSPAMLGFILGLVWMMLALPTPATSDSMFITAFYQFSQYLAQLTTPLSMFVIGMIIYRTGFKSLQMNRETFGVLVGRYLVSPIVVWLLALAIPIPSLMLKVFIVQSAMPAQNSMPILAQQYGADVKFTTTTQAYTFLIYLVVIPILIFLVK